MKRALTVGLRFLLATILLGVIARISWGAYNRHVYRLRNDDDVAAERSSATFYISPDGNDDYAGTSPDSAWRSLAPANTTRFVPGDSILLRGGTVFSGSLRFDADDVATPTRPITVSSFGNGFATIAAGQGDGIFALNTGGFVVSRLVITGSGREKNLGDGVFFRNDLIGGVKIDYIRIDSVEVSGFGKHGIRIDGEKPFLLDFLSFSQSGFRDVRITNADAHDNGMAGIYVYGEFNPFAPVYAHETVYVGYSRAHNNPGIPGPKRLNTGSGIVMSGVDGGVIEHSVAHDNGWLCDSRQGGPVGIWAWDATDIVIQFNESYRNRTAGKKDGGGFDLDGSVTNSTIQYNYSHDNDGAGYLLFQFAGGHEFSGNTVRYNISRDDGRKNGYAGIEIGSQKPGEIEKTTVYSNTILISEAQDTRPPAVRVLSSSALDVRIYNNLFYAEHGSPIVVIEFGQQYLVFQGNSYYATGGSVKIVWEGSQYNGLDDWRYETGQERFAGHSVGIAVPPQLERARERGFVGDTGRFHELGAYKLRSGSPLIDAGIDLRELSLDPGARDFFGNSLPQGPAFDVGAHEYPGGRAAPLRRRDPGFPNSRPPAPPVHELDEEAQPGADPTGDRPRRHQDHARVLQPHRARGPQGARDGG